MELLFCGLCHRRMQGSWNNDKPHYRCVYPTEYALANHTEHPPSLYLREELIVPSLDRWLLRAFSPAALPQTIQTLVDAQDDQQDEEHLARAAGAQRIIADCDQRLARYRAALEAGTDPTLIAQWTTEVNTTRAAAQAQLRTATGNTTKMTAEEISSIVTALGSILDVLRDADPADKGRGRDRPHGRPPARIPACGTTAPGSCLRFWRRSARQDRGVSRGLEGAIF